MIEFDENATDVSDMRVEKSTVKITNLGRMMLEMVKVLRFTLMVKFDVIQLENLGTGKDEVDQDDDDDDDNKDVEECPISHENAADMLDKCLKWLESQPEPNLYNLTTLCEL